MFLFLFSDFYNQAYKKRNAQKKLDAHNAELLNGDVNGLSNGSNQGACMVSFFFQFFVHIFTNSVQHEFVLLLLIDVMFKIKYGTTQFNYFINTVHFLNVIKL